MTMKRLWRCYEVVWHIQFSNIKKPAAWLAFPLQRFNASTLQRFNSSTLQLFNLPIPCYNYTNERDTFCNTATDRTIWRWEPYQTHAQIIILGDAHQRCEQVDGVCEAAVIDTILWGGCRGGRLYIGQSTAGTLFYHVGGGRTGCGPHSRLFCLSHQQSAWECGTALQHHFYAHHAGIGSAS